MLMLTDAPHLQRHDVAAALRDNMAVHIVTDVSLVASFLGVSSNLEVTPAKSV